MYSRVYKARQSKNSITLSDALEDPKQDNHHDYDGPEIVVVSGQQVQARKDEKNFGTKKKVKAVARKQNFVESLYRQTGLVHHRGDYESALYLYHRAASLYPRELRHGAVTRRTAAAISSANNPLRASSKVLLPGAKNLPQVTANFCPETVGLMAKKMVEESLDPVSSIKQILDYVDSRKDYRRNTPAFQDRPSITMIMKSKAMLKQSSASESNTTLKQLEAAFASGDLNESLKIGVNLVAVSDSLANRYHHQIAAHRYLAMIQIAVGRHDRAVDKVSTMVRLARDSGNLVLWSRSMMTLGKVHLSFGHLDAAARAWERLVLDVEEPIPKAWLLHEIGRCYFEMKRYAKALAIAARSIEYAQEANSPKWLMHGKLLSGQSLVQLGRYGEAVGSLTDAARAATAYDNHDQIIIHYISNLINRIFNALRTAQFYSHEFVPSNVKPMVNDITSRQNYENNHLAVTNQTYLNNNNNNNNITISGPTVLMKKSTINMTRSLSTISEPSESATIKNPTNKIHQRQRKNILHSSRTSVTLPKRSATFYLNTNNNDDVTSRITIPERFPHFFSSIVRDNLDEIDNDMLTYRTWVIRTHHPDGNSIENFESLDGHKIINYGKDNFDPDDQQSFSTGKTYVLDQSTKLLLHE